LRTFPWARTGPEKHKSKATVIRIIRFMRLPL
jgi:hypothetical protein